MKLWHVLLTPWIAAQRSTRWVVATGVALFAVADVLVRIFNHDAKAWLIGASILGMANGFFWCLLMSGTLVLALDAQRLRLPGVRRDVVLSLLLYALLGIGVPVLLQVPGGHVASFAAVLVLGAGAGALYALLPAYIGVVISFLPLLNNAAHDVIHVPGPSDPRFAVWGALAAALLVIIVMARWHQLLRAGAIPTRGLLAPSVLSFRRSLGSLVHADPLTDASLLRNRPGWMAIQPDLRRVGPHAPVKSLRVALGGVYVPQTVLDGLRQWVVPLVGLGLVGVLLFVGAGGDRTRERVMHDLFGGDDFLFVRWMFEVFSVGFVMAAIETLVRRWSRVDAELPLLALLPGLGRPGDIKRVLLRTVIRQPAIPLGLLLAIGLIGGVHLHVGAPVELAMLSVTLGCLGYLIAMALSILGGCPLPEFGKNVLLIGMFVLLSLTVVLPVWWQGWLESSVAEVGDLLGVGWVVFALFLLWLGRRGWRGLQQRPHPFLANG